MKAFSQYGGQVDLLSDLNDVGRLPEVDSDKGNTAEGDDTINIVILGEL